MSIWSPTDQQSVFKRYHGDKHVSEFYLQDGGKNQLTQIWNKITSLPPYTHRNIASWTEHVNWTVMGCLHFTSRRTAGYTTVCTTIQPWASAHSGKWGQLIPLESGWKINKGKHAKKEQFSEYSESNQGRQVQRTALCRPHIYSDILQNAPFRSQIFLIFLSSGGKGGIDPLTNILRPPCVQRLVKCRHPVTVESSLCDTIRDAILTCARKPT